MLSSLKKIFAARPKIARLPLSHPTLGLLTYSENEGAWLSEPLVGFRFHLAGDEAPDDALMTHAESVACDPMAFKKLVAGFLEEEAKTLRDKEDAVKKLEIERLCLFWVERPDDGMIYFSGGDRYGVWRCDYKNRRPIGLGFDS